MKEFALRGLRVIPLFDIQGALGNVRDTGLDENVKFVVLVVKNYVSTESFIVPPHRVNRCLIQRQQPTNFFTVKRCINGYQLPAAHWSSCHRIRYSIGFSQIESS